MKKLLILLFSLLISFNSYGLFGFFEETICVETDSQKRRGLIYLPNETKPFTGKNLCKYKNGQNKIQGKVKKGSEHSKWTWWHENGQKSIEGNYKDGYGSEYGKWTWWYESGQIEKEGNVKDGKQEGLWTYWYRHGEKKSESTWKYGECISGDC